MNILIKLQDIDRRILYVLVAAVISIPLIMRPSQHPSVIVPEVRSSFDILDSVPKDKIVIVSTMWGPGTEAENEPQTKAIMRHLFQKGTRFAVVSWDQAGTQLAYKDGASVADAVTKEGKFGPKVYGRDWVHLGYRYPDTAVMASLMRGMARDFKGTMSNDIKQTPLKKIPALAGVNNAKDIGAVVEITPSSTIEIWMTYFNMPNRIKLIYCPTAVMSAEAYPYLDAGLIGGMLNGVIGAAQYEKLIGLNDVSTDASATTWALSCAVIYVLVLIILGNLGYLAKRREPNSPQGGA